MKPNDFVPQARFPLRRREDVRTLGFLSALTLLYAVQWLGWCRAWPLLPLTAVLAFVACLIKHNHMHHRTFRDARWNAAFELWLSLLSGQPCTGIITAHNERHHGANNTDQDFVRCSLVGDKRNWLNYLAFAPLAVWRMWREKPSDLRRWRARRPALYRAALRERVAVSLVFLGLLAADWRGTLLYLVLPLAWAQWALVTVNLLQHQDCDHDSPYGGSRNVTGRLINWILLNNGFHTAHHLRPAMHWSDLPAFHRSDVAPHMDPSLNDPSLCRTLWKRLSAHPAGSGFRRPATVK